MAMQTKNAPTTVLSDDYKLELVQVLFRHGDRTPDESEMYPKDPFKNFDFKPMGHGQLTNSGKKRAYKLGELLRNRYESFGVKYDPEITSIYTTIFERCQMTLQMVLAGLYPQIPEQTWNENLKFNPISVEIRPPEKEMFYLAYKHPRYPELVKEAFENPEIKRLTEKYEAVLDKVVDETGFPRKFKALSILFRNIESKKSFGLPIPDWCDEQMQEKLKGAHEILFNAYSFSTLAKKLVIGNFLEKVISNIEENIARIKNTKMYLYSAHDTSVHAFLRAHNINKVSHMGFGATVVLEKLQGKDNKHYVRLLYWPGNSDHFEILKLENCDEICPYEKYLEIIKPVILKEGEEDYSLKEGEKINWFAP